MTVQAAPPPPPPTAPPVEATPSPWPGRLRAVLNWANRPRVRSILIGIMLLLLGGFVATSSVWTLPLLIAGALLIVVAWVGSRLDGRFAVEWGETGTQLEFRARIKSETNPPAALPKVQAAAEPEPEDAEVIESTGETIEIDVAELKALIAEAEAAEAVRKAA